MATYNTLGELTKAYDLEVEKEGGEVVAHVDNDVIIFTDVDHPNVDLLELHPSDVIHQALSLLGITVDEL